MVLAKRIEDKGISASNRAEGPCSKKNKEIIIGAYDGIVGFDNSLKYAAWIAYASNKLITAFFGRFGF